MIATSQVSRAKSLPSRKLVCICGKPINPLRLVRSYSDTAMACCSAVCTMNLRSMRCQDCGGPVNRHDAVRCFELPRLRCRACRRGAHWCYPEAIGKQHRKQLIGASQVLIDGLYDANPGVIGCEVQAVTTERSVSEECSNRGRPYATGGSRVYDAALTVVLRILVLAYAEDNDMLDCGFRDLADLPIDGWSRFIKLCSEIHADHGEGRALGVFDPDTYPFLLSCNVRDAFMRDVLRLALVVDGEMVSFSRMYAEEILNCYDDLMNFVVVFEETS